MQESWDLEFLKAGLNSRLRITCNQPNLYFFFFVTQSFVGKMVVKPLWFTLFCCRFLNSPLGELWELTD